MRKNGKPGMKTEVGPRQIRGVRLTGYTIGSWCPTDDGTGPAEAVSFSLETKLGNQDCNFVMRLKSPNTVDELVQALLKHRQDVWPNAKPSFLQLD